MDTTLYIMAVPGRHCVPLFCACVLGNRAFTNSVASFILVVVGTDELPYIHSAQDTDNSTRSKSSIWEEVFSQWEVTGNRTSPRIAAVTVREIHLAIKSKTTRRDFLKQGTTLAAAGITAPYFVPSTALAAPGRPGANDRIGVGFIGVGNRARQLIDHLPEEGQIVAICDVYRQRAEETNQLKKADWPIYSEYRELLDRADVDAVVVATPDHGRVLPCIHACQAGKDVYAEKPLTLTVSEGRVLVNAVRKYERVFQVGSQQRTMEMNRFACELVRSGGIGKLKLVKAINYTGPKRYTGLPEEEVPAGDNWNLWQAQAEERPFNSALQFGWMQWRSEEHTSELQSH